MMHDRVLPRGDNRKNSDMSVDLRDEDLSELGWARGGRVCHNTIGPMGNHLLQIY